MCLSGAVREEGYAVYKIREIAFGGGSKLSAEDGFLQFMIERLLSSDPPSPEIPDEDEEETGDSMRLTSIQSITDFLTCAGRTLPENIRLWARRNLAVARSSEVSAEERRHAQHALSIMMNIQWKGNYFQAIDPDEARRILDEELYGMEAVEAADYRNHYPDQPHPHSAGLRPAAGGTGRNGKIPDRLRGGPDFKAALDYSGHELYQRPGTVERCVKLPDLCQRQARYYYGGLFYCRGVQPGVYHQ